MPSNESAPGKGGAATVADRLNPNLCDPALATLSAALRGGSR